MSHNDKSQSELQTGFEVSKIMAHNGYNLEKQVVPSITFGQIAEQIGDTLADCGFPADRLDDQAVVTLVEGIKEQLSNSDGISWESVVQEYTRESYEVVFLIPCDIFENDCPLDGDEGSALASAGFGTDEDYGLFDSDPSDF